MEKEHNFYAHQVIANGIIRLEHTQKNLEPPLITRSSIDEPAWAFLFPRRSKSSCLICTSIFVTAHTLREEIAFFFSHFRTLNLQQTDVIAKLETRPHSYNPTESCNELRLSFHQIKHTSTLTRAGGLMLTRVQFRGQHLFPKQELYAT
jgi:hypothetical protein